MLDSNSCATVCVCDRVYTAGLTLGAVVSWVCYRQQRGRLADIDPATYVCGSSSSGGGGGGWGAAVAGSRGEEDGTPLLYTAPLHHQDQQQQQQQQSSVGSLPV